METKDKDSQSCKIGLFETMEHFSISEGEIKDALVVKCGKHRKIEEQIKKYGIEGPVKVEIYHDKCFESERMVISRIMEGTTASPIRTDL